MLDSAGKEVPDTEVEDAGRDYDFDYGFSVSSNLAFTHTSPMDYLVISSRMICRLERK